MFQCITLCKTYNFDSVKKVTIIIKILHRRIFEDRRLYGAMSGVSKPFHFIRLSRGMKEDIQVLLSFFDKCNGNNIFPDEI